MYYGPDRDEMTKDYNPYNILSKITLSEGASYYVFCSKISMDYLHCCAMQRISITCDI
jgi:hypothetical protein